MVKALDESFATDYTVHVLTWAALLRISQCSAMKKLAEFGIGKEQEDHYWNSLIRQMLLEGLLSKDIEEYGVLKITKKGNEFAKKPKSFKIVLNNLFEEANADDEEAAVESNTGAAADEKLV